MREQQIVCYSKYSWILLQTTALFSRGCKMSKSTCRGLVFFHPRVRWKKTSYTLQFIHGVFSSSCRIGCTWNLNKFAPERNGKMWKLNFLNVVFFDFLCTVVLILFHVLILCYVYYIIMDTVKPWNVGTCWYKNLEIVVVYMLLNSDRSMAHGPWFRINPEISFLCPQVFKLAYGAKWTHPSKKSQQLSSYFFFFIF